MLKLSYKAMPLNTMRTFFDLKCLMLREKEMIRLIFWENSARQERDQRLQLTAFLLINWYEAKSEVKT